MTMAAAKIEVTITKAALEAVRASTDNFLGHVMGRMLPLSRTAEESRMRAVLEALTPEERADLSCLGANLVELVNEIGQGG